MIEATQNGGSRNPRSAKSPSIVLERLDDLVGDRIAERAERRLQAVAIGTLIAAGLVGAIGSLVAAIAGLGVVATIVPLGLASLFLAAAAFLSRTGAFAQILWLGWTLLAAGAALAAHAGSSAGTVSAAILDTGLAAFLTMVPLAAVRRRRPWLAAALGASSALIAGGLAFAEPGRLALDPGTLLMLGLLLAFGGFDAWRACGRASKQDAGETATSATASGEAVRHDSGFGLTGEAGPERRGSSGSGIETTFEAAADRFGIAVLRLDGQGRIRAASSGGIKALGEDFSTGEDACLHGTTVIDRVHVADRVALLQALNRARSGAVERLTVRMRRPDGLYSVLDLDISSLDPQAPDHAGLLVLLAAAGGGEADATALQNALEAANQSSAAKSRFLAAVSHELRTPLNAIIGFSDILHQEFFGGFETERQKEYVGLIRQSGQHLLSVVNGLLDVSKIEAGRYELRPERLLCDEVMTLAASVVRDEALAKSLRLDVRQGCAGESLVADRQACHQILLNLLANAVKFTDAGVVTLESRVVGDAIEMSVCDTGIGIPEAEIARLGQPFVQVSLGDRRRHQGTGLGLSLVKGLAELHGGTMTIRSQPKIGTKVAVRLPLDCTRPGESSTILKENVVALNDARTKTHTLPQTAATRRTA